MSKDMTETALDELTEMFLAELQRGFGVRVYHAIGDTYYDRKTAAQIGARLRRRETAEPDCECELAAEAAGRSG